MIFNRRSMLATMALSCLPSKGALAASVTLSIAIELPSNRDQTGDLVLKRNGVKLAGPFWVYGRSDSSMANKHGNPSRDPTRPYGNTPTGSYSVPRATATGDGTSYKRHSYGPGGALVLQPTAGQALDAANNGRVGLLIHGGDLGSGGKLRATHGCLRLSDTDMAALLAGIATAGENAAFNRCDVMQIEASIGPPGDPLSGEDVGDPPPGIDQLLNPGPILP
jgi:hypothetical protein